ncbi:uncharacterized protein LOC135386883 [Ornithodoros turicata]|uniref:uncharacterized protein LOC135386883 n=1 Tax=Ornithodoros turicata TaxID=34597 RepID=UPI003138CF43
MDSTDTQATTSAASLETEEGEMEEEAGSTGVTGVEDSDSDWFHSAEEPPRHVPTATSSPPRPRTRREVMESRVDELMAGSAEHWRVMRELTQQVGRLALGQETMEETLAGAMNNLAQGQETLAGAMNNLEQGQETLIAAVNNLARQQETCHNEILSLFRMALAVLARAAPPPWLPSHE